MMGWCSGGLGLHGNQIHVLGRKYPIKTSATAFAPRANGQTGGQQQWAGQDGTEWGVGRRGWVGVSP